MKARKGPPKDYEEIRAKVARAAELMAEGLSEAKAAKEVGLPRSSLQHYLKHGVPNPGLPKAESCQDNLAGENRDLSRLPTQKSLPSQRDELGKFLPGNSAGSLIEKPTRQARVKFEQASPEVAKKLIDVFNALPDDRPELILAFAKEILDRGLGKPAQTLDIKETSSHEEYRFIEQIITTGDSDALQAAADLAKRLEEHTREFGRASQSRAVEIIPPPGKSLFDPGFSHSR